MASGASNCSRVSLMVISGSSIGSGKGSGSGSVGSNRHIECFSIDSSWEKAIAAFPSPGPYAKGIVISLTATPESGYQVKVWTGTGNDTHGYNEHHNVEF